MSSSAARSETFGDLLVAAVASATLHRACLDVRSEGIPGFGIAVLRLHRGPASVAQIIRVAADTRAVGAEAAGELRILVAHHLSELRRVRDPGGIGRDLRRRPRSRAEPPEGPAQAAEAAEAPYGTRHATGSLRLAGVVGGRRRHPLASLGDGCMTLRILTGLEGALGRPCEGHGHGRDGKGGRQSCSHDGGPPGCRPLMKPPPRDPEHPPNEGATRRPEGRIVICHSCDGCRPDHGVTR